MDNKIVGVIKEITGKFQVVTPDGRIMPVKIGMKVYVGEIIENISNIEDPKLIISNSNDDIIIGKFPQLLDISLIDNESDEDFKIDQNSITEFNDETAAGEEQLQDSLGEGEFATRDGSMTDVSSSVNDTDFINTTTENQESVIIPRFTLNDTIPLNFDEIIKENIVTISTNISSPIEVINDISEETKTEIIEESILQKDIVEENRIKNEVDKTEPNIIDDDSTDKGNQDGDRPISTGDTSTTEKTNANNGFGNGDQDAPGNSLEHNKAENNQNEETNVSRDKNDTKNSNSSNVSTNDNTNSNNEDIVDNKSDKKPNNGFGNGDQDAPGNSLEHNNAENSESEENDVPRNSNNNLGSDTNNSVDRENDSNNKSSLQNESEESRKSENENGSEFNSEKGKETSGNNGETKQTVGTSEETTPETDNTKIENIDFNNVEKIEQKSKDESKDEIKLEDIMDTEDSKEIKFEDDEKTNNGKSNQNENNGFGNGDQDAPGKSLENNNAENAQGSKEKGSIDSGNSSNFSDELLVQIPINDF